MAEFKYKAQDHTGRTKKGSVQASSKAAAKAQLRKMRLHPLVVKATKLEDAGNGDNTPIIGNYVYKDPDGRIQIQLTESKPSTKDLVIFTKQFAVMINSGVPLIQALYLLGKQQRLPAFGRVLLRVANAVENGATLSDGLEAYPKIFDNLYVAMVRAGEASGNLDSILLKLVTYIEKAAKIKSQVKSALMYPTVVVFVAVIVVTGLLVFVVPTFAEQYSEQGQELPDLTALVISLSNGLVASWHLLFAACATVIGAINVYRKTESGEVWFDSLLLKIPGIGQLLKKISVGRFCSTMAAMLTAGVNMLEALSICAASSGNKIIERFVNKVKINIEQGEKFSEPLGEGNLIPPMVVSMVAVGEATGALDDMLVKVSEFYEDEVDLAVKTLVSMIEPIMIVGIGSIVGFIVIAMYLPVFDMGNIVG